MLRMLFLVKASGLQSKNRASENVSVMSHWLKNKEAIKNSLFLFVPFKKYPWFVGTSSFWIFQASCTRFRRMKISTKSWDLPPSQVLIYTRRGLVEGSYLINTESRDDFLTVCTYLLSYTCSCYVPTNFQKFFFCLFLTLSPPKPWWPDCWGLLWTQRSNFQCLPKQRETLQSPLKSA